jgi:uncharacterized protein (DUF2141 family)
MSSLPKLAVLGSMLLGAVVAARAGATQKPRPKAKTGEIHFQVRLESNEGQMVCALFTQAQWLEETDYPAYASIVDKTSTCVFKNVPAGTYAISAFHDENKNMALDKNLIGIPTESWCTSRNAKGFMGPPSFDDAKFGFRGGKVTLRATM